MREKITAEELNTRKTRAFSSENLTRASEIGTVRPSYFPHKGSPKALVLLVQFKDVKFKKPISCALYPIRAKDFGNEVYGINYNKWRICKDAIKKGEELKLPVYKFLEGPLVEKFGKEWYDELCEVAEQVLAELED